MVVAGRASIVDVPRLAWKEETLVVSLPAFAVPAAPSPLNPIAMETVMTAHTYKLVELVGSSPTSTDEAIRNAVQKASATVKHIDWFQVIETRGHVEDGRVAHFQVTLKVGFRIESSHADLSRIRACGTLECRERGVRYTSLRSVSGFLMIAFCRARRRAVQRRPADWFRAGRAAPSAHCGSNVTATRGPSTAPTAKHAFPSFALSGATMSRRDRVAAGAAARDLQVVDARSAGRRRTDGDHRRQPDQFAREQLLGGGVRHARHDERDLAPGHVDVLQEQVAGELVGDSARRSRAAPPLRSPSCRGPSAASC